MEESNDETRCSFSTNWTIASGSLSGSVSFESSSDSPIEEAAASSPPPLLLRPPSPDPSPCEINICFTQKHEVRQVYVRSSARVYEIYYTPDPQSSNDYLCTVRCSKAAKDEELVDTIDIDEVHHLKILNKYVTEEKSGNDSNNNSSNNEDEWVDVKAPDSPPNRNSSLQTKIDANQGRGTEVLFEATAEISDANPCISLTLRLLSLQDKACVYVDEIYIFADPVESTDLESQMGPVGNSAQSSLMTMLFPALMQLSKNNASRTQEKQVSDTRKKHNFKEFGSGAAESTNIVDKLQEEGSPSITVQEEVKFQQGCAVSADLPQLHMLPQVLNKEEKPDCAAIENNVPHGHLESSLDQLVSRLARVEDLFLRFEEHMLRPINSIDLRLQRVEQQLEALNKKSQSSELPSCSNLSAPGPTCIGSVSDSSYNDESGYPTTGVQHRKTQNSEFPSSSRFFAPEFIGSDSGSFYNDGCEYSTCGAVESEKKALTCEKLSVPLDDRSLSVVSRIDKLSNPLDDTPELEMTTYPVPSLVVTAPEFPSADDEKENDALIDSSRAEQKQTLSIDDALASALAGFLTSSTRQPSTSTPILTVNAPEFSSGDDANDSGIDSPNIQRGMLSDLSFVVETNGGECMEHLLSSNISSLEGEEKLTGVSNDIGYKEMSEEVGRQSSLCNEGVGSEVFGAEQGEESDHEITEENYATEASDKTAGLPDSDHMYTPPLRFLEDEENVSPRGTQEEADYGNDIIAASEVMKEGCDKGILQDAFHVSDSLSTLDFETPIWDVEFSLQKISHSDSSLEALLTDMPDSTTEAHDIKESNDDATISKEQKSTSVLDFKLMDPETANHQLVDLDSYVHGDGSLEMENGYLQDNYLISSNNPEMYSASLL